MMKKRFLHLIIWAMLLTTALSAMVGVSYASGGPANSSAKADINGYEFTYTWDSTYLTNRSEKTSTENAAANVSFSGSVFELTATSSTKYKSWFQNYYAQDVQTDCTITNTSGITLQVTYVCSNNVTVTGAPASDTVVLGNGDSLPNVSVLADTTATNTNTVSVSGTVTITEVKKLSSYDLTLNPSSFASYTYSSGDISGSIDRSGTAVTEKLREGAAVTLTATLDSAYVGTYEFYGWMSNGKNLGTATTLNLTMDKAYDVRPVFLRNGAGTDGGPFLVGSTRYIFWKDAITAAQSGNQYVILAADYTMPTTLEENNLSAPSSGLVEGTDGAITYVVPSGITFLIPYDSTNSTGIRDVKTEWTIENSATGAYKTLTVPQGQTIRVQGTFQVNARVSAQQGGTYNGVVNGTYGKMVLDGTLDIRSGATLYARGYIVASDHTTHDNSSTLGHVEVASGANVYMPLQMLDYRGGSCSAAVGENVFPVSNYYFQNIMVSATYQSGAKLYGQWILRVKVDIIGEYDASKEGDSLILASSGEAMFLNTSGSITTNYQYKGDRLIINVDGPVTVNRIKVTAKVAGVFDYSMDTDGKPIPFNNVTINIRDGGSVTSAKPMKLVPGAEIVVQKGGTFTESDGIYLYQQDAFQARWYRNSTIGRLRLGATGLVENAGKTVKETDAKITVAGTMNITGSGTIWESSAHSRGVVGVDGGTISFASLPAVDATTTIYEVNSTNSTAEESTGWRPLTGLLAGLSTSASDNKQFSISSAGTYYAKDLLNDPNNAAWYQYTISVQDGKPGLAAVDPSTNFDNAYTTSDTVIGYSVNGGSFYVNAPGKKVSNVKLTVDSTALTPDASGVYTVSNINGNKTIVFTFRVAERTSAPDVWYETLQAAVAACDGTGYIKMIDSSTEPGFTLDKDLYLDLNSKTVTLTSELDTGDYKLYGMDSSTDDYDDGVAGKIVGTVSGTVAPVYQTAEESPYNRYVAIQNDNELSFHRFNISVTGFRFELSSITPECALFFIGTFRGDSEARDYLKSVGFTLSDNNVILDTPNFTLPTDTSTIPDVPTNNGDPTGEVVFQEPDTYLFEAYLIRAFSKENPTTYQKQFGAIATVTFDNGESWKSEQRKLSYLEAWQKVTEISNEDKARLDAFLDTLQTTSE